MVQKEDSYFRKVFVSVQAVSIGVEVGLSYLKATQSLLKGYSKTQKIGVAQTEIEIPFWAYICPIPIT